MAATYPAKGKGVASNASVNLTSPIPMAMHIWFIYSDDEDDDINGPEEEEVHEKEEELLLQWVHLSIQLAHHNLRNFSIL